MLLVTLFAHAFILQRVDRLLAGSAPEEATGAVAINARLLPPPEPPIAAPVATAPKPRPAPAVRKRAMPATAAFVPAPVTTPPPVEAPLAVDVAADAFGAEAPTTTAGKQETSEPSTGGPAAKPAGGEPPPTAATVSEANEPFEAIGAALHEALASRPAATAVLPPAARYVYRATNSELRLASGISTVDWSLAADGTYRLRLATTALGMTVLELESQGTLRSFGLAPERYTETRVRRGTVAANFDWEGRRVTFSARADERPLADGVQDRVSFQFQLMLLGQAQPERFREGRQMVLWMAGRDDVTSYRFRSAGRATTATGIGELEAVKLERIAADGTDARIEVWLAPSLGWLPAKLRFTDRYGRVTESVLESISTS